MSDIGMTAYRIMAETGLSARELAEMDMDAYARATGRPTPTQAALAAINAQHDEPQPVEPVFTDMATSPEPRGIDPDSDEAFLAWRANRTSGGEGKGLFDSVSSQSAEYRAAAARHAGRTGYGREVHPQPLTGRYIRQEDAIDHRSAAERLSNAANLWQGR